MSDFEEYIKVNYPRDYERQKRIYPDQSVEELYSEDYKMWQHQQAIIDSLKAQLNNMEACYIQVKKERDELQVRASELLEGVESAMVQLDNWTTAYEILDELRGERESFTETRQKVEAQIENGARLAKHQIDL